MTETSNVIAYWRKFFSDLFVGTFINLFIFITAGGVMGAFCTLILDNSWLDSSGWSGWLQWLVLVPSFGWFELWGLFHGLAACTVYIVQKKMGEIIIGLHDLLDILMKGVLAAYPNMDKRVPRKELEEKFETLGQQFLQELKLKGGPLSFIKRSIFQVMLKALKFFFLDDVMDEIKKKPGEEISRADLESAVRRVGVEIVLSPIADNLFLLHGANLLVMGMTLGLPFFLFWIFS